MKAVADAVGVTDASVLYWFQTKADLLLAVLEHYDSAHGQLLATMLQPPGRCAIEKFADWGEVMERDADLTALYVMLSGEHLRDGSHVQRYFEDRYARTIEVISDQFRIAVADGDFVACDPGVEASQLVAQFDGLRLQWFLRPGSSLADGCRRYVLGVIDRLSTSVAAERVPVEGSTLPTSAKVRCGLQ